MVDVGTQARPLQVAIVGSGPSGFYAAEALLRADIAVKVDMFDRLPTPFGLVRAGVAPDHPKIKGVVRVYDKIARSDGFNFLGNVEIGKDVGVDDLQSAYHAVILAYGASIDRRLGIPGEDLPGSHTATEFVGWYNGHPDYRECAFDFSHEAAVVVGQGNVAADVARILATPVDDLRHTDIVQEALEALAESRVRDIYVLGRRGPAQAKFTPAELKRLGAVRGCEPLVLRQDLELNAASAAELSDLRSDENKKNVELFGSFTTNDGTRSRRRIHFRFLQTPIRLVGSTRVEAIVSASSRLEGPAFAQVAVPESDVMEVPCGLVFFSVGYKGLPLPGLAFDERRGVIPNRKGRCLNGKDHVPGLYVTGWIKRGPTGIIGTNRADSVETVQALLDDIPKLAVGPKAGSAALRDVIAARSRRIVDYADWQRIDAAERKRGEPRGKPREKFTIVPDMLASIDRY